jgi:hypothetical protein
MIIKFRVWDWFCKALIRQPFNEIVGYVNNIFNNENDEHWIYEQYINVNDRNDNEIYIGDIIKGKIVKQNWDMDISNIEIIEFISEVKFINSAFSVKYKGEWHNFPNIVEDIEYVEIIGTIHDEDMGKK